MTRKIYPYSLDRNDAKIAGVCSTLGAKWGIDPTFIRIAWIAVPLLTPIHFTTALIAYAIVGIILAIQKKRSIVGHCSKQHWKRQGRRSVPSSSPSWTASPAMSPSSQA